MKACACLSGQSLKREWFPEELTGTKEREGNRSTRAGHVNSFVPDG